MKLLVVSHSCVTPVNQQLFAAVGRCTGWEMTLVMPSNWTTEYGKRSMGGRWPEFNGEIVEIPVWKSGSIPLHAYRTTFKGLLREQRPDAIYVHNEPYAVSTAQVYLANASTLRRPIGFYSAQNILKKYPPPFRWSESMVFRRSSFAFPVSQTVHQVLRDKGYDRPHTVLPLGVDPQIYFPRIEGPQLAGELRRNGNEILVGYIGRLVEEKGLVTLLHALSRVGHLAWRLVIIGSGPFQAEFDRLAATLNLTDRIRHVGFVPHTEAPKYLSACDVVVLPSETRRNWKEQFGRVIIESLACGTPVVGSNSGEIPHLIATTGGGLVFPEANAEAFAEQLTRLLVDRTLRDALACAGRESVLRQFTNAALAERIAEGVETAIRAGGAPAGTERADGPIWESSKVHA